MELELRDCGTLQSGFRKRGLANGVSLFFSQDETKESGVAPANQRKGQNEKFMNFAHFLVNSGVVFP